MALQTQDLTTYTLDDNTGKVSVTSTVITIDDVAKHDGGFKVYKDFGGDYFGDFQINFEFVYRAADYEGSQVLRLDNDLDYGDATPTSEIQVIFDFSYNSGNDINFQLKHNSTTSEDRISVGAAGTVYYCTLIRDGETLTLDVYLDSGRYTTAVAQRSITGLTTPLRYFYPASKGYTQFSYAAATCEIQNVEVNPVYGDEPEVSEDEEPGENWEDVKTKLRRFGRDPNQKIFSDDWLVNLYNDAQYELQNAMGPIEDVRVVQTPPRFRASYMHDHEWPYNDNDDGETYRMGHYYDSENQVCTNIWETEHLESLTPTSTTTGAYYSHPWESWYVDTPSEPPPIPLPEQFYRMKFIAWDRKPLSYITLKDLQDRDFSYKTRTGQPTHYYRDDKLANIIYLYPTISSVTWTDGDTGTTSDADPDEAEYADSDTDLDVDNNLLIIFDKEPTEVSSLTDESEYPAFVRKYLMHSVLSRQYSANTDAKIPSLARYWQMRKMVGWKIITHYLNKRLTDRNYRFRDANKGLIRSRRHPRLPDAYPSVYP